MTHNSSWPHCDRPAVSQVLIHTSFSSSSGVKSKSHFMYLQGAALWANEHSKNSTSPKFLDTWLEHKQTVLCVCAGACVCVWKPNSYQYILSGPEVCLKQKTALISQHVTSVRFHVTVTWPHVNHWKALFIIPYKTKEEEKEGEKKNHISDARAIKQNVALMGVLPAFGVQHLFHFDPRRHLTVTGLIGLVQNISH